MEEVMIYEPQFTDDEISKWADHLWDILPCEYDPTPLVGVGLGMFHCPACGEMILAGVAHPRFDLLNTGAVPMPGDEDYEE